MRWLFALSIVPDKIGLILCLFAYYENIERCFWVFSLLYVQCNLHTPQYTYEEYPYTDSCVQVAAPQPLLLLYL
jgi:hypothetical protein